MTLSREIHIILAHLIVEAIDQGHTEKDAISAYVIERMPEGITKDDIVDAAQFLVSAFDEQQARIAAYEGEA